MSSATETAACGILSDMDEREPRSDDSEESEEPTRPAMDLDTLGRQARSHNLTAYVMIALAVALLLGRCWS